VVSFHLHPVSLVCLSLLMLIMLLAASLEVSYEHTLNDKEVWGEGRAMQSKHRADFYSLVHIE